MERLRLPIVMRGSLGRIEDDPFFGRPTLHIYNDEKNANPSVGAGGGPFPDMEQLLEFMTSTLEIPVVDETVGPVRPFRVKVHHSAYRTEAVDRVLRNLEDQSGLEFVIEQRPVEVLEIIRVAG